jgi:hypothetical protein
MSKVECVELNRSVVNVIGKKNEAATGATLTYRGLTCSCCARRDCAGPQLKNRL